MIQKCLSPLHDTVSQIFISVATKKAFTKEGKYIESRSTQPAEDATLRLIMVYDYDYDKKKIESFFCFLRRFYEVLLSLYTGHAQK